VRQPEPVLKVAVLLAGCQTAAQRQFQSMVRGRDGLEKFRDRLPRAKRAGRGRSLRADPGRHGGPPVSWLSRTISNVVNALSPRHKSACGRHVRDQPISPSPWPQISTERTRRKSTLNFDYQVRSAEEAFSELSDAKADDEMLDLALHIFAALAAR
jgi:hypothetical protein